MKKIIAFLFAAALAFSASAEITNYAGFGWRIPTSATVESKNRTEKADVKFKTQTGLSFDYAGTFESGFSMRGIIDLNYSGSDLKVGFDEGDEMMGINFMLLAGVGYAPVRTEKMFLGLYGVVGVDVTTLMYEESRTSYLYKDKYELTLTHSAPVIGANATFIYTPAKSFSLFASVCANLMLPAEFKTESTIEEDGEKLKFDNKTDCIAAFKFVPTIGICWKF